MFKVHSAMTRDVITVAPGDSVYKAIALLVKYRISGLPVVDKDNFLIGIISEKDVLRLLNTQDEMHVMVSDFMTKGVLTFDVEDSLVDVAAALTKYNFRRVPILERGKLAGVVSRRDIIKKILQIKNFDVEDILNPDQDKGEG